MAKKQGVPLVTLLIILGFAVLLLSPTGQTFIKGLLGGKTITPTPTEGPQDVNRKLSIATIDSFTGAAGSGTIKVYASDGKTLLETVTIATSIITADYYPSGTVLVLEYNDASNSLVRKKITVPQMLPADIQAVTNNPITLKVFTNCAALTASCVTDSGNTITDASTSASFNITKEGTTGSISFTWYVPTDNTGYLDSYDEIDGLNWYAVVYAKLSGTNYEYVSLNGWDGQYTKGTAVWYYKVLAPTQVTKYKVGNTYVYSGTSSITFDVEAGSYSGDAATAALFMYIYTDPAYHNAKGSFGPDSFQIDNYSTTGFQIYFTD